MNTSNKTVGPSTVYLPGVHPVNHPFRKRNSKQGGK